MGAPVHMLDEVTRSLHQALKETVGLSLLHVLVLPDGILFAKCSLDPSPLFLPMLTVVWCEHEGRIPPYARASAVHD